MAVETGSAGRLRDAEAVQAHRGHWRRAAAGGPTHDGGLLPYVCFTTTLQSVLTDMLSPQTAQMV